MTALITTTAVPAPNATYRNAAMQITINPKEPKMSRITSIAPRLVALTGFALLAGCAQMNQAPPAPAAPAVAYNPPGTALAALPSANIAWFHVAFASGSSKIGPDGQQAIAAAAAAMQANPATVATVVGRSDAVGGDAANMRLSQQRAMAVSNALLATGKAPGARIETRWIGERPQDGQPLPPGSDPNGRVVDIAVH